MESEIIYLFMYDTGTRFTEPQLSRLLENPEDFSKYEFTKPEPEEIATFDVPSIFNLKEESHEFDGVTRRFKVQVAVYLFGAFSIRIRHQITEGGYGLISKMTFDPKVNDFIRSLVAKTRKKVESALSKNAAINTNQLKETYRFYYIEGDKIQIVSKSRKLIAGLLIDEKDGDTLESDYIDYILNKSIAYDSNNILFVGWESAVMIDKGYLHEQELLIAEIANLQLLEMRIYHNILTEKLDTASKTLNSISTFGSARALNPREIGNLNKSLGNIYDSTRAVLNNVNGTVFGLGEWYLSRVYSLFSNIFKLDTWKSSLETDLEAIDKERKFVADIEVSRHESFLEWVVIALIFIEVIIGALALFK